MAGSLNPFVTMTLQVTRRNLESWCVDSFADPNLIILLTFNQNMDQSVIPLITDFEGTDGVGAPINVTEVHWDALNVLRVHYAVTFEEGTSLFRYLGPTPRLLTLTGEFENAFTLHTFPACGAKFLEDLKTHDPTKPYPPWSKLV